MQINQAPVTNAVLPSSVNGAYVDAIRFYQSTHLRRSVDG
jgi:hypothetical protein